MKVSDTLSNPAGLSGLPAKDDTKVRSSKGSEFHSRLVKAADGNYEQHLQKLAEDITRQGEVLARKIDIRELKIYKKLIAEFLDVALGNSRKFSKRSLLDRRGRHKVYAIVRNINSELDKLTQDILQGEKENLSLLQRLSDIRGLILDLLL